MTAEALQFMDSLMAELSIPYAFLRAGNGIPLGGEQAGYYFTGEYTETPSPAHQEVGCQETAFLLRGYTDGDWLLLERAKQLIRRALPRRSILPNGNYLSILYHSGSPVPSDHPFRKSIKIVFTIQEWSLS